MTALIREATPADAAAIAEVHVASWRVAYEGVLPASYLSGLSTEIEALRWRRTLLRGQPGVLVADVDGVVAGWIAYGASRDPDTDASWGEVETLYVLPEFWGAGLGRRLMDAARRKLSRAGMTDVALWVLLDNQRARTFYSHAGFSGDDLSRGVRIARKRLTEVRYSCPLVGPWEAASVCMIGL